jgi:Zn-dependent alcohol dehydrogenase
VMGGALAGAQPLIAVEPVEGKRKLALELGATAAFAPAEADDGIRSLAAAGVDFAFEAAGIPAVLEAAFRATRRGGTTVAMGLPHPAKMLMVPALAFAGEGKTLAGSYMGSSAPQRDIPRYLSLFRAGRLPVDRLRTAVLPLSRINDAFEALAKGDAVRQVLVPRP